MAKVMNLDWVFLGQHPTPHQWAGNGSCGTTEGVLLAQGHVEGELGSQQWRYGHLGLSHCWWWRLSCPL